MSDSKKTVITGMVSSTGEGQQIIQETFPFVDGPRMDMLPDNSVSPQGSTSQQPNIAPQLSSPPPPAPSDSQTGNAPKG